jgi:Family of unknown function (DUF6221)
VSGPDELAPWLRREVGQDMAAARDLIESEAASPVWSEMTSGVLVTGPPEHDDTWSGTFAMGDSRLTRFIAGRDPRWVIADCEAKLAVLDEHDTRDWQVGDRSHDCQWRSWPCRTVRLLGYGYRFRPGYREAEWKP